MSEASGETSKPTSADGTNGDKNYNDNADEKTEDDDDWKVQRDESKALGDGAFRSGDFESAIEHYGRALSVDPENATILSNRSAAYLKSGQKSRALHDAQECVRIGTMGIKGQSRLAAALQSLSRYDRALETWKRIVEEDSNNQAANRGIQDCERAIEQQKKKQREEEARRQQEAREQAEKEEAERQSKKKSSEDDLLDEFFDDVEEVASTVAKERLAGEKQVATDAIKNHKKDLGTAALQVERLLKENYKWRNLNPFYVLDIPHTASKDDISRRYKALSLLLHPDKNRNLERAQEAYDEVLKAKAILDDENKAEHVRQLVKQGMKQGKVDWEKRDKSQSDDDETLQTYQSKAVQRIFAQVEHSRRDVERRERNYEQRERQQEEEQLQRERNSRAFEKGWKQEGRVEKRIGNWREFQHKGKKSKGS